MYTYNPREVHVWGKIFRLNFNGHRSHLKKINVSYITNSFNNDDKTKNGMIELDVQ